MREARGEVPPRYRADIDGLRAIAVTSVVLFHAHLFPFASGYVGVDIFFVISGYLIGGIILRDVSARRFSFATFYARRARRILPALITVVLACCLAGWFLLSPNQFRDVGATAASALLGISNISYFRFRDYFAPDARLHPLLMTWSLGVEEQFYLCFPFLVFGIGRWAPRKTLAVLATVVLVSFFAALWCTYTYPAAAFYLLPFRAWELGAGVILAFIELARDADRRPVETIRHDDRFNDRIAGRSISRALARLVPAGYQQAFGFGGLAILAFAIFGFDESTPFPGLLAVLPVLGTAALISAGSSWINRAVLSSRPMVFVGAISYSWYLWHWPLMSYVRNVAFDEPALWVMILTAAVAFCLAMASWRFIEQPFRHGTVHVRPTLLGYATALTVALAFPLAIKLEDGFPRHVSPQTGRVEAARREWTNRPCLADWDDDKPNLSPSCVIRRDGRPTVAVIGDSHANSLAEGVGALAAKEGWGYEVFAKALCRPLIGVTDWRLEHPGQPASCEAFMADTFSRVLSDPSVQTVILAGAWPRSEEDPGSAVERFVAIPPFPDSASTLVLLHQGLERAVDALTAAGKHVVIVGDVPRWRFDVLQVALSKAMPLRARLAPWFWSRAPHRFPDRPGLDLVYQPNDENTRFFESLAQAGSVAYVDLFPRFCRDGTCSFELDGKLLFIDKDHLSSFGSRYAMQDVRLQ